MLRSPPGAMQRSQSRVTGPFGTEAMREAAREAATSSPEAERPRDKSMMKLLYHTPLRRYWTTGLCSVAALTVVILFLLTVAYMPAVRGRRNAVGAIARVRVAAANLGGAVSTAFTWGAARMVDADADDDFLPSLNFVRRSVPRLLLQGSRVDRVRDDPVARHSFWRGCLAGAIEPACRPDVEPRILSYREWHSHTTALLDATSPYRKMRPHVYANPRFNSSVYAGPWLEHAFIAHFLEGGRADLFYPLVPLFVPWTDVRLGPDGGDGPYAELMQLLWGPAGGGAPDAHSALRQDIMYIALIQGDRFFAESGIDNACRRFRNVVVLSASGWGDIAVPLVKGFNLPYNFNYWPPDQDPVPHHRRRFALALVAVEKLHGRSRIRRAVANSSLPPDWLMLFPHDTWRWMTHSALVILSPPGTDRAAFRTAEMLQYGRIPLLVHDGTPWTPYQHNADFLPPGALPARLNPGADADVTHYGAVTVPAHTAPTFDPTVENEAESGPELWSKVLNNGGMWGPGGIGFVASFDELPSFLCIACDFTRANSAARWRRTRVLPLHLYGPEPGRLCPCTRDVWMTMEGYGTPSRANWTLPYGSLLHEMERRILTVAPRYFTYEGIVAAIEQLARSPADADLKCIPKPATLRGPGGWDDLARAARANESSTGSETA